MITMANLLLALVTSLLFLITLSSALVQVSIDCGASAPYTDENGIKWVTDDEYIKSGKGLSVKNFSDSTPKYLKTLRVFSSMKKNCYSIDVKGGGKIRLRVSFNYGNYDGKGSAPSFEVLFDSTDWATVQTSMSSEVSYEVVYTVSDESTDVCVGQNTPGQLPFVSAIQVWQLDNNMYSQDDQTAAFLLVTRKAYGATRIVRYPDDAYDRIWFPSPPSSSLTVLTSDASSINSTGIFEQPPTAVMKTAVMPSDPASLVLPLDNDLPPYPVNVYINFYFSEPTKLSSQDTRSFALVENGIQISDAIVPRYAAAYELYVANSTASASDEFSLQSTTGSTLPPILNAMEVFTVTDPLNSTGTNESEGPGMQALWTQFDVLQNWQGDPCLPQDYNWDWVGCSSDDSPRITSLYLSGYGLSGELPDFSSLTALETIDLHNNSLGGAIPEFLGKMPNLKQLNLADNSFSGPMPSSLANNKKIKLNTTGNPNLCEAGQSCKVIAPVKGGKTTHGSNAHRKSSYLASFLGLVISLFSLAFVF